MGLTTSGYLLLSKTKNAFIKEDWLPTPVFLPGEFHGQRATVHGITKSWTRLSDQRLQMSILSLLQAMLESLNFSTLCLSLSLLFTVVMHVTFQFLYFYRFI